jgi:hypothetical protein
MKIYVIKKTAKKINAETCMSYRKYCGSLRHSGTEDAQASDRVHRLQVEALVGGDL